MKTLRLRLALVCVAAGLCCAGISRPLAAACFEDAAARYGVSPALLRAIASVESGMQADAVGRSPNGTSDFGLMQINSSWLQSLGRYGVTSERLLRDPCLNVHVGAWIMASAFARYGHGWEAVGSYNVGCRSLSREECVRRRYAYAWRVYRALRREDRP
ncbi:MAG TPA: lytic transglycosylase domain-containing protein [Burkholderiaceae bacterium]|nr:lytic transglycosylase domain-containing protein [Burkholderiaceae bacterium]